MGPEPPSRLCMQLGLNHLADLTHAEYKAHYLGYRADLREARNTSAGLGAAPFRYENASPPEQVDWVKAGAVTKVKNQQQVRFARLCQHSLQSCRGLDAWPLQCSIVLLLHLSMRRLRFMVDLLLSCSAAPAGRSPPLAASKVTCCSAHALKQADPATSVERCEFLHLCAVKVLTLGLSVHRH